MAVFKRLLDIAEALVPVPQVGCACAFIQFKRCRLRNGCTDMWAGRRRCLKGQLRKR